MATRRTAGSILAICFLANGMAATAATDDATLTLERIFSSAEFDSKTVDNVQWSADGTTFTRAVPGSGHLDIHEHDLASARERVIVSGARLRHDGRPIDASRYAFSPDRRFLLLTGPRTLTWDHVTEAPYFVYDTESKSMLALADGSSQLRNVRLSPDGRHVGYVRDNNLYVTALVDGKTRAVTTDGSADIFNGLFDYGSTEFGFTEAWHWSPDGRKLAFWRLDVSDVKTYYLLDELGSYPELHALKYPNTGERHAVNRIGVYDLGRNETTWVTTGDNPDDYIPRIDWSRSADLLAVQRLTRDHQRLDVLMANTNTGSARTVLTETDPAWIDITADLLFLDKDDRFVWTSEKSGYRHAYLYDYAGKETRLTGGDWEISSLIGVDEVQEWLYFYAKKESFLDQHVYRVRLDGSGLEKLTDRPGWYEWRMSPDRQYVIETWSNASTPPEVTLRTPSGETIRVLEESNVAALSRYHVPEPEFMTVETSDGIELNAYMIRPPGFDANRRYPVIAYGYGNAGSQVVVNRWGNARGPGRDLWHRYMAQQGYIVFSLDNRTTAGRGKAAKRLTYGHYAKYAIHDQLEGARFLKSLPYVDPDRLGFWGWSGGGYLAAALMTKGAPHFRTGVSVAPVIDLSRYQAVGVERWMGLLGDNAEGYRRTNLLNYADRLDGNLLLIHGTGDENVKYAFTLQFADALIAEGKQFDMFVYPNQHHGIVDAQLHVYTKISNYFRDNL